MTLVHAGGRHGGHQVFGARPVIEEHHNVTYVPPGAAVGGAWGLFDSNGQFISACGTYRGPVRHLVMPTEPVLPDDIAVIEADDDEYTYAGAMHGHFGHFLLSTLSRFWPMAAPSASGGKLICSTVEAPHIWFAAPHVTASLGHLGLHAESFAHFTCPVRIRRLMVPRPSFEELNFVHTAFADLCHRIGGGALAAIPGPAPQAPVYLSKARLPSGVWRMVNEQDMTDVLARHGVDVVFPETLSLDEQIGLFARRPVVCGTAGSALHVSIFAKGGASIVALNHDAGIVTNCTLIDAVNANRSTYLFPEGGITPLGGNNDFSLNYRLHDAVRTAEEFLRYIDTAIRDARMSKPSPTIPAMRYNEPTLDEIGLKHGTDKSSASHDYLHFYEGLLAGLRDAAEANILEIGVYDGASLRMWEEFFPNAKVLGADIDPRTLRFASNRTRVELVDQSDVAQLMQLAMVHGPFDLIVDDGSHQWDHQITSFRTLYPFVRPGGTYVMEDIHTSYGVLAPDFKGIGGMTGAEYLQKFCDYVVADEVVDATLEPDAFIRSYARLTDWMSFRRHTCVIRRKAR